MEWKLIFSKVESLEIESHLSMQDQFFLYIYIYQIFEKMFEYYLNHNFIFIKYFMKRDYIKDDQKLQLHI